MCNVKQVASGKIKGAEKKTEHFTIYLDTELTKELKEEALLREVIRKVQDMRKKANMIVKDKIELTLDCEDLKKFTAELKKEVGAERVIFGSAAAALDFEGRKIGIEIKRV
jgi:isoleucyl-tRNA synthetase